MSSSNKTPHFDLNFWSGSDIPSREDFNRDNVLIDDALNVHIQDTGIHVTAMQQTQWDHPFCIGTYVGNGSASRTIQLAGGFAPQWGILYAVNRFPSEKDFANQADYNYFAFFSQSGSTVGVSLGGNELMVAQSGVALAGNEYRSFNESGVTYVYIVFR